MTVNINNRGDLVKLSYLLSKVGLLSIELVVTGLLLLSSKL